MHVPTNYAMTSWGGALTTMHVLAKHVVLSSGGVLLVAAMYVLTNHDVTSWGGVPEAIFCADETCRDIFRRDSEGFSMLTNQYVGS